MASSGQQTKTFTIPAGAGAYASAVIHTRQDQTRGQSDDVSELTLMIESLPAAAAIEVDLLKPGGDPDVAADWLLAVQSHNTIGLKAILQLASWRGARVRGKSGGTGGNAVVHCSWW